MPSPPLPGATFGGTARFGTFELDLDSGALSRRGRPVSLQDQQTVILKYLVERAGITVTRDELQTLIWPEGTFVQFEVGLYSTMNRLRRALGDSASAPHFIETVPKQGYRFIAAVDFQSAGQGVAATLTTDPPEQEVPEESASLSAPATVVRSRFHFVAGSIAILGLGVAAGVFVAARFGTTGAAAGQVYRYTISVPGVDAVGSLAVAPGGDQIVFAGPGHLLYRRYLDRRDPGPIRGTEGGRSPFFSPDGQSLGFFTEHQLNIAEGDRIRHLAVLPDNHHTWNAVWGEDGFVYFNSRAGGSQGIWRIRAAGGQSQSVVRSTHSGRGSEVPFVNQILARPRHLMVYSVDTGPVRRSLRVRDLDTQADKMVVERGIGGRVLAGRLIYYNRGSLFAIPFDPVSLETQGTAVEMVKDVATYWWQSGRASVSDTGTLAYVQRAEPELKRLEWLDAGGRVTPVGLQADQYEQAVVSPGGDRLAIVRQDQPYQSSLWTYELRSGAWRHILDSHVPLLRAQWSPDESALVVSSERQNEDFVNLSRVRLDDPSNVQRLTEDPDNGQFPLSWSAKSQAILFIDGMHELTNSDIMVLPLSGNQRAKKLVASPGFDRAASFSPDGRHFAYESDPKGQPEVFVQPYDAAKAEGAGAPVQISNGGGQDPVWSPDGRRVYYLDPASRLIQVDLSASMGPVSRRTVAESVPGSTNVWTRAYSMAPDGRLLIIRPVGRVSKPAEIQVVVNWVDEVKRLLPSSN